MASKIVEILLKQKHLLRVALTQVKVDHLNKKVSLPLSTHALVENTLWETRMKKNWQRRVPKGTPGVRRYAQPVFRFKKHRTPRSVYEAYLSPPSAKRKTKLEEVETIDNFGRIENGVKMLDALVEQGMWGFVETHAKPPIIHYWTDGKRSEDEMIHFFGHEMGHCVGRPMKRGWPEENRADDYGYVAQMAIRAARKACRDS